MSKRLPVDFDAPGKEQRAEHFDPRVNDRQFV